MTSSGGWLRCRFRCVVFFGPPLKEAEYCVAGRPQRTEVRSACALRGISMEVGEMVFLKWQTENDKHLYLATMPVCRLSHGSSRWTRTPSLWCVDEIREDEQGNSARLAHFDCGGLF
jgi:hypothetical protein